MRLKGLRLSNFRSYKDEKYIEFGDLTALIGKNDIGKSTLFEALEIFFNNTLVVCEKEDLSVDSDNNDISISCIFSDLPDQIVVDESNPTTLKGEFLLNGNDELEIRKVFSATTSKPKEKVFIMCVHPTTSGFDDLLTLKHAELKKRADELGIDKNGYDATKNAEIRRAIWDSKTPQELNMQLVPLLVDKEDTKKVYEQIKQYLPIFAMFQSDRPSKDDDKEVSDPMKIAVQQALKEVDNELNRIKEEVRNKAIEAAQRTLDKLREMNADLAHTLTPEFKTEPKFDSLFKLTINSDDGIPINKRGSGVRRLILLNFFRAEAEQKMLRTSNNSIIYAFEEPETSQHPSYQKMLLKSLQELSLANNCQVMITTHTPALASLLPLESLRYICEKEQGRKEILSGTEEVFNAVCDTLGVLPEPFSNTAKALLLVEGKSDVVFIRHTAKLLKDNGYISNTLDEKNIAIVPIGGCGNLKHWRTKKIAEQFHIPWAILLDSDKGSAEEELNKAQITNLKKEGIKAYVTRKREPENYIDIECIRERNITTKFSDTDDVKKIIKDSIRMSENDILEKLWVKMSISQIREAEKYVDENGILHYEFTEMIQDFLSLVD